MAGSRTGVEKPGRWDDGNAVAGTDANVNHEGVILTGTDRRKPLR
jgi:hypothetical protein